MSDIDQEDESARLHEEIQRIASYVHARKLEAPCIFLLEAHRPIRGLLYHGITASAPIFAPLFGTSNINTLLYIMEDEQRIEMLLQALEQRDYDSPVYR